MTTSTLPAFGTPFCPPDPILTADPSIDSVSLRYVGGYPDIFQLSPRMSFKETIQREILKDAALWSKKRPPAEMEARVETGNFFAWAMVAEENDARRAVEPETSPISSYAGVPMSERKERSERPMFGFTTDRELWTKLKDKGGISINTELMVGNEEGPKARVKIINVKIGDNWESLSFEFSSLDEEHPREFTGAQALAREHGDFVWGVTWPLKKIHFSEPQKLNNGFLKGLPFDRDVFLAIGSEKDGVQLIVKYKKVLAEETLQEEFRVLQAGPGRRDVALGRPISLSEVHDLRRGGIVFAMSGDPKELPKLGSLKEAN